ncbi:hypothetical protein CMUS01_09423 [Colletotrichum musicola]|uniref:Uncharacterized protein n=1 Tax=Colletotrichum musicola TaxID=2175873 RepID=A0A8H6K829_9PEZI|nr:hypothetical protein CMUS01_09423 [Colletotrichum musicola]
MWISNSQTCKRYIHLLPGGRGARVTPRKTSILLPQLPVPQKRIPAGARLPWPDMAKARCPLHVGNSTPTAAAAALLLFLLLHAPAARRYSISSPRISMSIPHI